MGRLRKAKPGTSKTKKRRKTRWDKSKPGEENDLPLKQELDNEGCGGTVAGTLSCSQGKVQSKYSIHQLLEQVQDCMDTFNYDMAQMFLRRALEMEPDNVQVLECSGNLLIEVGELEKAKHCLGRAITLSPDAGYSKYMYMGQLFEGQEAVGYFSHGIQLMKEIKQKQEQEAVAMAACANGVPGTDDVVTEQDIASAYCSMAEIYLTDSCLATDSDQKCKACIDQALEMDSDNAEAHQLDASYWISKDDTERAKKSIETSVSLWLPKMAAIEEEEKCAEAPSFDPTDPCPMTYQNRVSAAKILLELDMNELAEEILEGLLQEDDQVVQIWYMLGLMNAEKTGDEHKPPARYYLYMAKKLYQNLQCDDEPVLVHTEELLSALGPGEGLEESWLMNQLGEESDIEETDDDEGSSDEECMEH